MSLQLPHCDPMGAHVLTELLRTPIFNNFLLTSSFNFVENRCLLCRIKKVRDGRGKDSECIISMLGLPRNKKKTHSF